MLVDFFRLLVAAEGALIFGETLYIYALVGHRLFRAPMRHILAVSLAHNLAVAYMVIELVVRSSEGAALSLRLPAAAFIFALTHYALWVMVHALRERLKPEPIPKVLTEDPDSVKNTEP